jgi:hypothetical protein
MRQIGSHWKDFHEIWYGIFVENLSHNCSKNLEKRSLTLSCLSVGTHGTIRLPLEGFSWNLILNICRKSVAKLFEKFRKEIINFVMSVHPSTRENYVPTGSIFMKFDMEYLLKICIMFRTISVSHKQFYRKSKHAFYAQRLFSENHAIYEIMWKNRPDRPHTPI